MALKIAGVKPVGFALEIICAIATIVLVVATLAARDRGVEFVREDLVEFRKVLAAHAFSWAGVQTMFVYMISFVQYRFPLLDATAGGQMLSRSFLVLSAVGALMPAFVLEPLTRRFGQVAVHVACLALMALGFAGVYLYGTSPLVVYALMALMGIGWAAIVSLPFAIMSQRVDQGRIGLYMGVFNLSVVLPQLLTSLAVGKIVEHTADKGVIFVIGAGCLALSALAWLFVRRAGDEAPAAAPRPQASAH
jgi:Na+/melibiose symporter-like transporter